MENTLTVRLAQDIDPAALTDQWIYIENDGQENAAYRIFGAEKQGSLIALDLDKYTLIRSARSVDGMDATYNYNIAEGQSFRIPLAAVDDTGPVVAPIADQRITAGNRLTVPVQAESPAGRELTYEELSLPRGAQFDPASGVFSWTPDSSQIGTHPVGIAVSDGALTQSVWFKVEVYQGASGGGATPNPGPGTEPGPGPGDDDGDGEKEPVNPPAEEERFVDLAGYDWAKSAIESLAEEGIIKGDGPNTFGPGKPISRADFTILLVRAFNISGGEAEQFGDVPADAYYAQELLAARAAGIAEGVGGNRFNPQGRVSRQDMMVLLYRTLQKSGYSLEEAEEGRLASFADSAQVAEYAQEAAAALIQNGIIAGDKGRIKPQSNASRAEVAVMLSRVLEKKQ